MTHCSGPIAIRVPALCTCMENAFTIEQVKAQELAILDEVDWNLEHYNPHGFLDRSVVPFALASCPQQFPSCHSVLPVLALFLIAACFEES